MEQQFIVSVPGQEVEVADINGVSQNAAFAVDRALAQLLRMGSVNRGIIPGGTAYGMAGVLRPSGSANASLTIQHFRAVLSAALTGGSDPLEAWQGIRSAVYVPGAAIQFAAQAAGPNSRFDLLYARVDVDVPDAPVLRYQKDTTDAVNAVSVAVTKSTKVSVGVVQGVAAASPVFPALPADSGSSYYLVLGYVLIQAGFTLTTSLQATNITEAFTTLPLSPSAGVPNIRPASVNARFRVTSGSPNTRQNAFLPPSMVGGQAVVHALHLVSGDAASTYPAGSWVIDDSIDWRQRYFKITISMNSSLLGWALGSAYSGGATNFTPALDSAGAAVIPMVFMGQSFRGATKAYLVDINNARNTAIASGTDLRFYVDMTNGTLCVEITGAVNVDLLAWFEATGYYPNPQP